MKYLLFAAALAAPAQTTPRGVHKQAKADGKMERTRTVRYGERLRKEPKLVRQEDRLNERRTTQDKP